MHCVIAFVAFAFVVVVVPQEKAWEETRDGRVASWRDFKTKATTKKKVTGEFKPPKASTSDDAKTYVRRVVGQTENKN